jgi:peptidoglycan/xylan/chitin deacetylase (PgdA/CDA1 family)
MIDMWDRVRAELDCWQRENRIAEFWWRDDDATKVSPPLRRMLSVANSHGVVVGLSVIPAQAQPSLAAFVQKHGRINVLVHGYAHKNHEGPSRTKREFGGTRRLDEAEGELAQALNITKSLFGVHALAVLVPPWNRISPGTVQLLPRLGYKGISTWKPRRTAHPAEGLTQVNAHLDLIDWRRGQAIKSEELVASLVLRKLRWRRAGGAGSIEPLGLLTHHLLWNSQKEKIVLNLFKITNHPAARWLSPRELFGYKK